MEVGHAIVKAFVDTRHLELAASLGADRVIDLHGRRFHPDRRHVRCRLRCVRQDDLWPMSQVNEACRPLCHHRPWSYPLEANTAAYREVSKGQKTGSSSLIWGQSERRRIVLINAGCAQLEERYDGACSDCGCVARASVGRI
jgi:hypothetical protein